MAGAVMTLIINPASRTVLARYREMGRSVRQAQERFTVKCAARFLRDTQLAFVKHAQPGGEAWPANQGDSPGGYAWFKREKLGLSGVSTGFINGELKNSITSDVQKTRFRFITGTAKKSGKGLTEGGPSPIFFAKDRDGRWWGFGWKHEQIPPRPFLPSMKYAEETVVQMLSAELQDMIRRDGFTVRS